MARNIGTNLWLGSGNRYGWRVVYQPRAGTIHIIATDPVKTRGVPKWQGLYPMHPAWSRVPGDVRAAWRTAAEALRRDGVPSKPAGSLNFAGILGQ